MKEVSAPNPAEHTATARWQRLSGLLGILITAIGLLVLVGWAQDIPLLKSLRPEWVSMKVNTAVAFVCAGAVLWLRNLAGAGLIATRLPATVVMLIGGLSLLQYLTGMDLGIDQWLFREEAHAVDTLSPNRMAPLSAVMFLLTGISLWLDNRHSHGRVWIEKITLLCCIPTAAAGLGFLYGVQNSFGIGYAMQLAAPTVLAFFLLQAGLLCAQPGHGVMALLRSQGTDGLIVRRVLPVATLLPVLIGWIWIIGEHEHWFDPAFGIVLVAMTYMVIFWSLGLWTARVRSRRETEILLAHVEIQRLLTESNQAKDALRERIKELRCLNAVSRLSERADLTVSQLLQGVVGLLPPALRFPEHALAAIDSDWGYFGAPPPPETPVTLRQLAVKVHGEEQAVIRIWYAGGADPAPTGLLTEEETLLDSVARLVGDAIARLHDAGQVQRLSALYEMLSITNRALVYCKNSDELLANIFEALAANSAFPILFIAMSDKGSLPLRLTHLHGIPPEHQPEISRILSDPDSNLQRSYSVLTQGKAVSIPIRPPSRPVLDTPHEQWLAFLQSRNITARAVVPLVQQSQVIGIITLYVRHGQEYLDEQQMQLLNEMAADLSFGLNTLLLDQQRQAAERQADLSESRFRDLFEASPVPMQIISAGGESLQASNQAHRQWLGYEPEELLTEDMAFERLFADPGQRRRHRGDWHQAIADAVAGKIITSTEMDVQCKDGSTRMARYTVRANVGNLIVVWNDLTDIRLHEQQLIESEKRFRGMIEQTISGMYIRRDGKFLYTNPRFCEITGWSAEELLGRDVLDFTVADEADVLRIRETWAQLHQGRQSVSYTVPIRRKDGQVIELGLNTKIITWDDGLPATIVMAQDITERKRAEERIARYVQQLEGSMKGTLQAISNMVELRDPYTAGHERRVGLIAGDIAREMGWPAERCETLEMIGLVHDIGKIAVPSEILTKPTRLTHVEMEIIKCHAQAGYDILKNIDFAAPVAETIRQHHERMDGSGYPQGLKGDEILPEARVLAVADVVESMAAHRPYRAALGIEAALAEITRGRGSHYDADAVDALLRLVHEKGYTLPQ